MALTVTNVSRTLVVVRLISGESIHLRPGERTGELAEAEIRGNPQVETLAERHLVSVDAVPEATKGRRGKAAPAS